MAFVAFGSSELQSWSQGKQYKILHNEEIDIGKVSIHQDTDIKVSRV